MHIDINIEVGMAIRIDYADTDINMDVDVDVVMDINIELVSRPMAIHLVTLSRPSLINPPGAVYGWSPRATVVAKSAL